VVRQHLFACRPSIVRIRQEERTEISSLGILQTIKFLLLTKSSTCIRIHLRGYLCQRRGIQYISIHSITIMRLQGSAQWLIDKIPADPTNETISARVYHAAKRHHDHIHIHMPISNNLYAPSRHIVVVTPLQILQYITVAS